MIKFKKSTLNKNSFELKVAAGTVKNDDIVFLSNEKKIWSDNTWYDCDSTTVLTNLNSHISNKSNPHSVTKALVGLGNVDNTSDANKPVSTAQATAIADAKKAGTDALANLNTHTANKSNPHAVTKAQVGLGNVTNESKATMFTNPAFTGTPTAPTAATNTNNTLVATTLFVLTAIDTKLAANDAMLFKGTIGTGGTVTALPNTHNAGWTYKVITAGTYAGIACEVGDMIICITDGTTANNAHWTVVQTNIDGAVTGPASSTDNHVATFNGATGKIIKDSGITASSGNVTATKYIKSGGTSALFLKADGSVDNNSYALSNHSHSLYLTAHLSLADYVTLNGRLVITGLKIFNYPILHKLTGTWLDGMRNGSVIDFPTIGYDSLVHWKTKDGHISISCFSDSEDVITFGYMGDNTVVSGNNVLDKSVKINVSSCSVTADYFFGNASSASKLITPRTLTVGNTGKNFDGTSNVSWSLTEIGAAPAIHTHSLYVPFSKQSVAIVNNTNLSPQFINVESENLITNYKNFWSVINLGSYSGNNFRSQIAMPYEAGVTNELFIRTANGSNWNGWNRVLHDGNYTSYLTWNNLQGKPSTFTPSAHNHSYNDLTNKPTIPTVGNGTVTIMQNGVNMGSFTLNQSGNATIALTDRNTIGVDTVDNIGVAVPGMIYFSQSPTIDDRIQEIAYCNLFYYIPDKVNLHAFDQDRGAFWDLTPYKLLLSGGDSTTSYMETGITASSGHFDINTDTLNINTDRTSTINIGKIVFDNNSPVNNTATVNITGTLKVLPSIGAPITKISADIETYAVYIPDRHNNRVSIDPLGIMMYPSYGSTTVNSDYAQLTTTSVGELLIKGKAELNVTVIGDSVELQGNNLVNLFVALYGMINLLANSQGAAIYMNSNSELDIDVGDTFRVQTSNGGDIDLLSSYGINLEATNYISANRSIAVSSDKRSKHDIKQIPDSVLENINKIEYKQFKYNNGNEDDEYGVIAQEVLETGIPNIVRGSEEDLYSVNYNNLFILEIVNLKKQIKELQDLVKTLLNVVSELS